MTVLIFEILIDPQDSHLLADYRWYPSRTKNTTYATSQHEGRTIYLHRLIMGEPVGMEVHHGNGNGLDCRRENLEIVTHKKNIVLMRRKNPPRSGYQGVIQKPSGRYQAGCMVDGKRVTLGTFDSAEQASGVYEAFVQERAASL